MALVGGGRLAGLVPDQDPEIIHGDGVTVELDDDEPDDAPNIDEKGNILRIEHGDGSVTVSLDGKPLGSTVERKDKSWFDNLVDDIDDLELGRISNDLDRGIRDDIDSRKDWIEARANGIKLLGLTVEVPGLQGASDGAPVEGMSKVRHPLLLEAVLRFQANARGEMLPADGPVKVRNDATSDTQMEDREANALETDLNHYLTAEATEYYPDTDRMLLLLGFGGTSFKKGYFCPLRGRAVLESVDADDLIVNNAATDLQNAKRITHRVMMKQSTVTRMQILGVYRDVDLPTPAEPQTDSLTRVKKEQQGISEGTMNPEDRDRELYECYCELDIKGYEHKQKGAVTGLAIPYRVTMDVTSKKILAIVRNYDEPKDAKALPNALNVFVKYTFVPGFGFYDIGLLHILGNTTNALSAAWREMLDNGMYANFPGFLISDAGGRQNTTIFRVPPGGGAQVKTGGMKIGDAIAPMPYNSSGQAALQALSTDIASTGMRVGGTSEQAVGEGRADAPVGTTLALIDQATKMLNAVHKRMHSSQAEEFKLLVRLLKEHPESFLRCKHRTPWDEQTFLRALDNCNLVPQADPNTASQTQRLMKIAALKMLQQAQPQLYNPIAIDTAAIQALGFSNPEQFFADPQSMAQPSPEAQEKIAKVTIAKQDADTRASVGQAKVAETQTKIQTGAFAPQPDAPEDDKSKLSAKDALDAHAKLLDALTRAKALGIKIHETKLEDANRDQDRMSRERVQMMEMLRELIVHPEAEEELPKAAKEISKVTE